MTTIFDNFIICWLLLEYIFYLKMDKVKKFIGKTCNLVTKTVISNDLFYQTVSFISINN